MFINQAWLLGVKRDDVNVTCSVCGREDQRATRTSFKKESKIKSVVLLYVPAWPTVIIIRSLPTSCGTKFTKLNELHISKRLHHGYAVISTDESLVVPDLFCCAK